MKWDYNQNKLSGGSLVSQESKFIYCGEIFVATKNVFRENKLTED